MGIWKENGSIFSSNKYFRIFILFSFQMPWYVDCGFSFRIKIHILTKHLKYHSKWKGNIERFFALKSFYFYSPKLQQMFVRILYHFRSLNTNQTFLCGKYQFRYLFDGFSLSCHISWHLASCWKNVALVDVLSKLESKMSALSYRKIFPNGKWNSCWNVGHLLLNVLSHPEYPAFNLNIVFMGRIHK